ncbi:MAG TPA: hypothetical protein PKN28_07920, partial [Clostridiales bacterium]|nr:hypothetical protein [Clostridiales bacterium]
SFLESCAIRAIFILFSLLVDMLKNYNITYPLFQVVFVSFTLSTTSKNSLLFTAEITIIPPCVLLIENPPLIILTLLKLTVRFSNFVTHH